MALIECPECGKEVSPSALACPNCGYGVKKHFDDITANEVAEKRKAESAMKRQQRNKFLKIVIPLVLIIGAVVTGFVINHIVLSERMLFDNEDEMLSYLTKSDSWKLDNDYKEAYLSFYQQNLCSYMSESYNGNVYSSGEKISLHPSRGYFEIGRSKYYISKSGDVVNFDKTAYYKSWSKIPPFENGYIALKVEIVSSKFSNGYFEAEYKVTNTGKLNYRQVFTETVINCSNGEKICIKDNLDFEYASIDDKNAHYLEPNKTATVNAFMKNAPSNAETFNVYIKSYESEYI